VKTAVVEEVSMVARSESVDILMATYNGARFLKCQVESILEQMRPGWRILVRDDGSSDETVSILRRFADRWPECITLIDSQGPRLGPSGNFTRLMQCADADYVAFSDQDDVWLPSRMTKTVERIKALEGRIGRDAPVLVHTDLAVVDEELRQVSPSFWKYCRLNPRVGDTLNGLLVQNMGTGCATTVNRALLRMAYPVPAGAMMHDWWMALVAAACGRLEYIAEPTVLYRQHASNVLGARRWHWTETLGCALRRMLGMPVPSANLPPLCAQARILLRHLGSRLSPENRAMVAALSELEHYGFFKKRSEVLRYKLLRCGLVPNLGWLTLL
jgi:hypothetical protein